MPSQIVGSWAEENDFGQNGLNFTPGGIPGTNRIALLVVGGEENGAVTAGPMSVGSATLGGRTLNIDYQDQVGADDAYHNTITVLWLDDAEIELMVGNAFLVTWVNFPGNGPFETSPVVHYATYRDVNQTTPNGASGNNQADSSTSLSPSATMNVAIDEQVLVFNVAGQPMTPSSSAGGLVERTEYIGGANDMLLAVYDRTALTADATYTWTVDLSAATRHMTYGFALQFDEVIMTVEQDGFRFYEDGTEAGAAALEAQNVDLTIGEETIFGVRQGGQIVGNPPGVTVTIEYKKTGDADTEFRKLL